MEELRVELHETNIGTSVLFPGFTATKSAALKAIDPALQVRKQRPARPRQRRATCAAASSQMDAMECAPAGRWHTAHDLFIFSHQWRTGTQARMDAIMASFVEACAGGAGAGRPYRCRSIFAKIEHRPTAKRNFKTV
jgi:hypothetical protein